MAPDAASQMEPGAAANGAVTGKELDPAQFLDELGVASYAQREVSSPHGPIPLVDAMRQCGAIAGTIKAAVEASRRTAAKYGVDAEGFDPSDAMEVWIEQTNEGTAMREAHEAAHVELPAPNGAEKK